MSYLVQQYLAEKYSLVIVKQNVSREIWAKLAVSAAADMFEFAITPLQSK